MPSNVSFQRQEVEDYERKRYRGLDQRLVDRRERRILREIFDAITENLHRVLDIPSGYGRFSELVLERGWVLVSSDLSFYMVRRARERSLRGGFHSAVVSDAKAGLPFKKDAFSVLVSMRFFHHLHKREEREFILKEFSTICTRWVILSYYKKTFVHRLQRKLRRGVKKTKTRIHMMSRCDFEEEVSRAGLRIEKIFPLFRIFHAHHIVLLKKG